MDVIMVRGMDALGRMRDRSGRYYGSGTDAVGNGMGSRQTLLMRFYGSAIHYASMLWGMGWDLSVHHSGSSVDALGKARGSEWTLLQFRHGCFECTSPRFGPVLRFGHG